jgi:hypothetical protein
MSDKFFRFRDVLITVALGLALIWLKAANQLYEAMKRYFDGGEVHDE